MESAGCGPSAGFKKEWPMLSRSPILTNRSFYEPYHRSVPIPAEGWLSLAGLREIVPGRCLTASPHTPLAPRGTC